MEELILKKKPNIRISKFYCIWFQFSKFDNQKLNKIKRIVNNHLKGTNFSIHLTVIGPYLQLDKEEFKKIENILPLLSHELTHTALNHVKWRDDDHGRPFNSLDKLILKHLKLNV